MVRESSDRKDNSELGGGVYSLSSPPVSVCIVFSIPVPSALGHTRDALSMLGCSFLLPNSSDGTTLIRISNIYAF